MNYSVLSFALSVCVLLSAVLTSAATYFGLPETHPLAPPIFLIVFFIYLPELPLMWIIGNCGYPLVLPGLSVLFAILGFRRAGNGAALGLDVVRIISARGAGPRERKKYHEV